MEQIEALSNLGIEYQIFLKKGKGIIGYLKNYKKLIKTISNYNPDIIHAHYGLTGLLCNLQRNKPVITTYHGSDINNKKAFLFSKIALKLSTHNIFVSEKLKLKSKSDGTIIPCGLDFEIFYPINKRIAREEMGLSNNKIYTLFSSHFSNPIKNYNLAKNAIDLQPDKIEIIELKNYDRKQVCLLLNAVDFAILTSFSEGSPQFIKEAMACNCPIVATNVGDIENLFSDSDGVFLTDFDTTAVSNNIKLALNFSQLFNRTNGRDFMTNYNNKIIANKIITVYNKILN